MILRWLYSNVFSTVPSSPPLNVRVTATTYTSITVAWDPIPCLLQNNVIEEYRTHVAFSRNGFLAIHGSSTGTTGNSYTANGLQPATGYFFQVYSVVPGNIRGMNAPPLHTSTLCECKDKNLAIIWSGVVTACAPITCYMHVRLWILYFSGSVWTAKEGVTRLVEFLYLMCRWGFA